MSSPFGSSQITGTVSGAEVTLTADIHTLRPFHERHESVCTSVSDRPDLAKRIAGIVY
jgi:hypothetical protein